MVFNILYVHVAALSIKFTKVEGKSHQVIKYQAIVKLGEDHCKQNPKCETF